MTLDPQAQALLEQMKAMGFSYTPELTVTTAREMLQAMLAVRPVGESVASVENRSIPGPAGDIPVRIYSLEDSYEATKWVVTHAPEFGGDPSRIAIVGDSSGGNMATVVTLLARDRGGPKLAFQLLMFPATDFRLSTPSMEELGEGYNVTKAQMIWIRNNYLPNPADWTNPLAPPLLAPDLSGLPPVLIIYAEYDPLRDDAEAYAARLKEAGVSVKASRYDGMIHDFIDLFEEPGERALAEIAYALRAAFA